MDKIIDYRVIILTFLLYFSSNIYLFLAGERDLERDDDDEEQEEQDDLELERRYPPS